VVLLAGENLLKQDLTILDIRTKRRFLVVVGLRIWETILPVTETDFIAVCHIIKPELE